MYLGFAVVGSSVELGGIDTPASWWCNPARGLVTRPGDLYFGLGEIGAGSVAELHLVRPGGGRTEVETAPGGFGVSALGCCPPGSREPRRRASPIGPRSEWCEGSRGDGPRSSLPGVAEKSRGGPKLALRPTRAGASPRWNAGVALPARGPKCCGSGPPGCRGGGGRRPGHGPRWPSGTREKRWCTERTGPRRLSWPSRGPGLELGVRPGLGHEAQPGSAATSAKARTPARGASIRPGRCRVRPN